ncbi:MAG TPA: FKBP-type peptidyl-prolyl cis-trans isomerase [Opitutaceae bacterium]|nr:FKBP-type peptidyl-prolyl cis-trans isomerase [Opitutaceae bacterium]
MKLTHTLTLGVLALGLAAGAHAQDIKVPGAAATETKPAVAAPAAYSESQVLEALGWIASKNIQLETFGFTPTQLESVLKGIEAGAMGKDLAFDKAKIGPLISEFVNKKQSEFVEKLRKQGVADTAAFFAKLKENKNVVELPSGLRYEILKPGEGAYPKPTETVKVHYVGTLVNGTVFDSSLQPREPGAAVVPVEFSLDSVIPGWTEGIQKINKGGKIKLYVPPHLGYGDDGRPGIPPASTLIFEVELLDIKPTPAAAPAAVTVPAPATGK